MVIVNRASVLRQRIEVDTPCIAPMLTTWSRWESVRISLLWSIACREMRCLGYGHVIEANADLSCYALLPGHWVLADGIFRPLTIWDAFPFEDVADCIWMPISSTQVARVPAMNFRREDGRTFIVMTKGLSNCELLASLVHEAGHAGLDKPGDTRQIRENRTFAFEGEILRAICRRGYGKLIWGLRTKIEHATQSADWHLKTELPGFDLS